MRKILNKYSCVIFFFIVSFVVFVNAQPEPDPNGCCDDLGPINGEPQDSEAAAAYNKCLAEVAANPNSDCADSLPIDNSLYILMGTVSAVAIASFVIARRIKT